MSGNRFDGVAYSAGARLAAMAVVGLTVGVLVAALGKAVYAPAAGWAAAATTFLLVVALTVGRVRSGLTGEHATREDGSRTVSHLLSTAAVIASFGAIALLLVEARSAKGLAAAGIVGLAFATVALSWLLLHTLYALRYAAVYYQAGGGIDFNQKEAPDYGDFFYLAFTLGMAFQVSDTDITTRAMRRVVLRHALLSYLIGAVVVGLTVNLVSGLAS
ncbi:MAG: hypothetical protein QOC59_274 [Microbacteriaceae bacterium]|nr:hypothetical protein [Microbacteriaceae bacterium]